MLLASLPASARASSWPVAASKSTSCWSSSAPTVSPDTDKDTMRSSAWACTGSSRPRNTSSVQAPACS